MPTYLYKCPIHGEFEHQHSIHEELEYCPLCEKENEKESDCQHATEYEQADCIKCRPPPPQKVKRLIAGGSTFILNGSGWAKDNYN